MITPSSRPNRVYEIAAFPGRYLPCHADSGLAVPTRRWVVTSPLAQFSSCTVVISCVVVSTIVQRVEVEVVTLVEVVVTVVRAVEVVRLVLTTRVLVMVVVKLVDTVTLVDVVVAVSLVSVVDVSRIALEVVSVVSTVDVVRTVLVSVEVSVVVAVEVSVEVASFEVSLSPPIATTALYPQPSSTYDLLSVSTQPPDEPAHSVWYLLGLPGCQRPAAGPSISTQ